MKQQQVMIGCKMLSKQMINNIKFDIAKPQFMKWLTNKKIFLKSNSLGMHQTTTISYITKVYPHLTNCTNLKGLLCTALKDITINATLAIKCDPTLKELNN